MKCIAVVTFLVATTLTLHAQSTTKPGNAQNGRQLFVKHGCYQCHGYEGQGSNAGAKLAPKPMPLTGMIAYVRKPSGLMPPVTAKVVSDQDMTDIHAFLSSIPPAPDVKSIPLLNQ
jgi:mono/diheme cytochrome c family protein